MTADASYDIEHRSKWSHKQKESYLLPSDREHSVETLCWQAVDLKIKNIFQTTVTSGNRWTISSGTFYLLLLLFTSLVFPCSPVITPITLQNKKNSLITVQGIHVKHMMNCGTVSKEGIAENSTGQLQSSNR